MAPAGPSLVGNSAQTFQRCLMRASLAVALVLATVCVYWVPPTRPDNSAKVQQLTGEKSNLAVKPFIVLGPEISSDLTNKLTFTFLREGVPLLPLEAYQGELDMGVRIRDFRRIKRLMSQDPEFGIAIRKHILPEIQAYLDSRGTDLQLPNNSEKANDDGNVDQFDKWALINMALTLWYPEQQKANSLMEPFHGTNHRNIDPSRDPARVLDQQAQYLSKIATKEALEAPFKEVSNQWYQHQLRAANILRLGLRQPSIIQPKHDYRSILDLQQRDVAVLKRELLKTGREQWGR